MVMPKDENKILVECKCGLIFRLTEKESEKDLLLCDYIPEKDLGYRLKKCERNK